MCYHNLKEYNQLDITPLAVDDIVSLVTDISNMPTEYFEAKPQRAVGFDEVKALVVPDNISEDLKAAIDKHGINMVEYEQGNNEDRLNKLNSIEDVRFSKNVDDFNENEYNYPKLSHNEYMHLSSEIIENFPNVINKINSIYLISNNKKYIYKMDKDRTVFVYGRYIIKNKIEGENASANGKRNGFSKRFKGIGSGFIDDRNSFVGINNSEITGRNDGDVSTEVRRKGQGNDRGYAQNGNNVNLQEEDTLRKSLNDTKTVDELAKENERLKAALEIAKREIKLTDGHKMNKAQVDALATGIVKKTSSTYDKAVLSQNLNRIFEYIANNDDASYDVAMDAMADLSKAVLEKSTSVNDELYTMREHIQVK